VSSPTCCAFGRPSFRCCRPRNPAPGHRLYRRKDVELLLRIKHLLRDKRFTIEGARQSLQAEAKAPKPRAVKAKQSQQELFTDDPLPEIRRELAEILRMLK
jgi:DNA-binding transcriptional MerR regulator